jgi:exodeoxyribonuclease VII small subunit
MASKKGHENFEAVYRRLEQTVDKLEAGGLTLDEAIALYEEGVSLAQGCQQMLEEAELRIARLQEAFVPYEVSAGPREEETTYLPAEDDEEIL